MKQKILQSIRISEDTDRHIRQAIEKYNRDPKVLAKLGLAEFRRLSYELLAQSILQGKDINATLQS